MFWSAALNLDLGDPRDGGRLIQQAGGPLAGHDLNPQL
jgi:hypothetical protein